MLLAMLSELPDPQQGESVCMLSLTPGMHGTYRIKALTPGANSREIGRWISNCPLTAAESALLWISRFQWQIQQAEGAMDINGVLNQVESLAPMHPQNPDTGAFIHPLDQAALLLSNLPSKDPSSLETGAVLQLGTVQPMGSPPRLPAPGHPVTPPRLSDKSIPAHPRRSITGEARETALFLRNLVHGLRDGASLEQINEAARDFFDDEEDENPYPPAVYELAGQILRANPKMPEETALTQALQIWKNQRPIPNEPAALPPLPRGIRAIRSDERPSRIESIDPRAPQPRAENSADRGKVERTWNRAAEMSRRADEVSPLPPGIHLAPHGAPLPDPPPLRQKFNDPRGSDGALAAWRLTEGNLVMASTPEVEVQLISSERTTLIPMRYGSVYPDPSRSPIPVPIHDPVETDQEETGKNGGGPPLLREDLDRIAAEQIAAAAARTAERQARVEAARQELQPEVEKAVTQEPYSSLRVGGKNSVRLGQPFRLE